MNFQKAELKEIQLNFQTRTISDFPDQFFIKNITVIKNFQNKKFKFTKVRLNSEFIKNYSM